MFNPITEEKLSKLRALHDRIKAHPFRKTLERCYLDEYFNLFNKDLYSIIGRYTSDSYELERQCIYSFYRSSYDRWLHFKDSSFEDGYFHFKDVTEIWSNPNIGLINEAYHDLRGIKWSLVSNWDNDFYKKEYIGKFVETTEKMLTILHALIDGVEITEMDFPKEHRDGQTHYKFVKNPLYDNDWTLEKYLHREWWEDKGYTDDDVESKNYVNKKKESGGLTTDSYEI